MKKLALWLLLGLAAPMGAKAQAVVNLNAPPVLTNVGSGGVLYEYNLGGGLLVQPLDGAGNVVSALTPLPVQLEAGGGGSATVNQGNAGVAAWLVQDANNASFSTTFPMAVGTSYSAVRMVQVDCPSVGGAVVMALASGTETLNVLPSAQSQFFPFAATQIVSTTGTCTFTGLR